MPKEQGESGGDLFIVDNSVSGWTALRYLREWTELSKSFDIATGYFEIGSLLDLDGGWQKLAKIRILMGDETSQRTRKALLEAVAARAAGRLDQSLEAAKDRNPFLNGVPAIVEALKSGQIECRVYDKNKFHAKTYITHATHEVIGSKALVGSSNFTTPGLTQNVELNIQVQSGREVAQLQEWFNQYWEEAKDVTPDVVKTIYRHIHAYTPFEIYAKALQEFFRGHELTDTEWEETRSKMFPRLDRYQKEGYWGLMKIARQHGGALLCDGVGLGKTFVGLMLIEHLILHDRSRVVLFAPKGAKESVWEPHLREFLPHIGGVGGSADFSNLAVFSHTDLTREGDFPERFRRVAELADAVVIDEAHNFRNIGKLGEPETGEDRSRYYRLFDLLDGSARPKRVFLLTATPINNRVSDFRHMVELFSRRDEAYFARTLGVNNLTAYFNQMEKELRRRLPGGEDVALGENLAEAQQALSRDEIFRALVIQRSRAYAKESQVRETGSAAAFPERRPPKVAEYSIRQTYGRLLEIFEKAFARTQPLFRLPIYYPLAYYKGPDTTIDPLKMGRQKEVVSLIRTQFLKRFESSVCAFELSCDRLMKKLLAFLEVHSETEAEKQRLERWKHQHDEVLRYGRERQLTLWGNADESEEEEDVIPPEFLEAVTRLSRDEYDVGEIMQETFLDLDEIARFMEETRKFEPKHDDKLKKLVRLLNSKDLEGQKVLIFTEFADTARYLLKQLQDAEIEGVAQVDSGTKGNRADVIRRFSPYYNGSSSAEQGSREIRVLVSTDVLSEGLNLQDASKLINYDIHWNPVRLMQRIGRVDRRLNPAVEERLLRDHPEVAATRRKVDFWNFLPPDELNAILTLYTRVTQKTLLISKTMGIEGKKLLTPEDDYDALKEFSQAYEGTKSVIEEMHLEYQAMLEENPELAAKLKDLPGGVFSGKRKPAKGTKGVFFCYALPALDKESGEFTEAAGTARWYLVDLASGSILEDPKEILVSVRSKPNTPRKCAMTEASLVEIRTKVLGHIKETYLKRVDAPIGVRPSLKCWMEINEG